MDKNVLLREIEAMKRRMDTLYAESFVCEDTPQEEGDPASEAGLWEPLVDIWENGEVWVLVADLPGVADEDLQVEILDHQLTIKGKRGTVPVIEGLEAFRTERPDGEFSRTFALPDHTRGDGIQAKFNRGVLTVTVPKLRSETAAPRRVSIQTT